MKPIFLLLITSIFSLSYSQTDSTLEKIKIKVTVKVNNYYILKPFAFYNLYYKRTICEGNYYLNNALNNTFINKNSYGVGCQIIKKVQKMHYGISVVYMQANENYGAKIIYDTAKDSTYHGYSNLSQIGFGVSVGRQYKFKHIKVIPTAGLSYLKKISSNSKFVIQDSENLPNYKSIDIKNLYANYSLTSNIGCDVSFFHANRISPYVGYYFIKSLTNEATQSTYKIKISKFNNLFVVGVMFKI